MDSNSKTVLTSNQWNVLQEFRVIVEGFLPEEYAEDDAFLLRWLVAREFHQEKASVMLKNYIEWKDINEIDKILEWSPPEEMMEACPFQVIGDDLEGRPVLLFPWGIWKPWVFTGKLVHIYRKYMDYMIQSLLATMKPPATQFVIIGDSSGFTYGHLKHIKSLEANLEAVRDFDAHYPELLHSAICINCPKAFTVLYALIKPMMSQRTRNKLNLFGTGADTTKWKEFMAERIPQDILPCEYRIDTTDD